MKFFIVWFTLFSALNSIGSEKDSFSPCADGMKLGYVRKPKGTCSKCAFTDHVDRTRLYGEFDKVDQCDEARLLDEKKFDTSKGCFWRYVKDTKHLDVFEVSAMKNGGLLNVIFKTEEACQKAVKNGHEYFHSRTQETFSIEKKHSPNSTRFIGDCEKKKLAICEKFKEDGAFVITDKLQ